MSKKITRIVSIASILILPALLSPGCVPEEPEPCSYGASDLQDEVPLALPAVSVRDLSKKGDLQITRIAMGYNVHAFSIPCSMSNAVANLPPGGVPTEETSCDYQQQTPEAVVLFFDTDLRDKEGRPVKRAQLCDSVTVLTTSKSLPQKETLVDSDGTKELSINLDGVEGISTDSIICNKGPLALKAYDYFSKLPKTRLTFVEHCVDLDLPNKYFSPENSGTSSGMPPGTSPSDLPPVDPTGTGSGTSTSSGGDNQKYQDGQGGAGGMGGDGGAGGGFFMGYCPPPSAPNPISTFARPLKHRVATI